MEGILILEKIGETTHEERKVVSTTRNKEFFKKLEENTWILGDVSTFSKFHFIYKNA